VEKEERKTLASAGCNVTERVFSAEEVRGNFSPSPSFSSFHELSHSPVVREAYNREEKVPARSM
jgi:hypothetical protein